MSASNQHQATGRLATWQRYWLYQLPGIMLAAGLAAAAVQLFSLPSWAGVVAVVLWVIKDAALYPLLKASYQPAGATGPAALIGAHGTVRAALDPVGQIKVGPELWQARSSAPIAVDKVVRVIGCTGMTLLVESAASEPDGR